MSTELFHVIAELVDLGAAELAQPSDRARCQPCAALLGHTNLQTGDGAQPLRRHRRGQAAQQPAAVLGRHLSYGADPTARS